MQYDDDFFGPYGGAYIPEVLRSALDELKIGFADAWADNNFRAELDEINTNFIGRPTPFYHARNLGKKLGGSEIFIKLEGLANTGAHKINNAVGQALLARRLGKRRIIAETGAGQHGLATAAASAMLGLECHVYMGEVDMERQRPNVFAMELYGAEVIPVKSGSRTLKDAINAALRDWASSFPNTHYLIGSALGPAPYPAMVRAFQSVIGKEVEASIRKLGLDLEAMVACVGGGSNASGFFAPFTARAEPRLVGVEAGGRGPGENAIRMDGRARCGIVHGYRSRFITDSEGQLGSTHSISAGLDYPGIGPELAYLGEQGRIEFTSASDEEALNALMVFAKSEGILFALESAHAGAVGLKLAAQGEKGRAVIINMSGRGEKDLFITAPLLAGKEWFPFLERELEKKQVDGGRA